jgi:vacuolar-type H+-ATPase subunit H
MALDEIERVFRQKIDEFIDGRFDSRDEIDGLLALARGDRTIIDQTLNGLNAKRNEVEQRLRAVEQAARQAVDDTVQQAEQAARQAIDDAERQAREAREEVERQAQLAREEAERRAREEAERAAREAIQGNLPALPGLPGRR